MNIKSPKLLFTVICIGSIIVIVVILSSITKSPTEKKLLTVVSVDTTKMQQLNDSLVTKDFGLTSADGRDDWGAAWNRIRNAAEWTPNGTVTTDKVLIGETFYNASRKQQVGTWSFNGDVKESEVVSGKKYYSASGMLRTGTLTLTGNVTVNDVRKGKTFYGDSFTQHVGTLALTGNANSSQVFAGQTFYSDSFTQQTGTWTFNGDTSEADVVSGKKFYSDTGVLRTGNLTLLGDVTVGDVVQGKTFYGNSLTQLVGTLALTGNAGSNQVFAGQTFYNNSFNQQTGTFSFNGTANAADVASGKTFYNDSSTVITGTAVFPALIDYAKESLATEDDRGSYKEEESLWVEVSGSPFNPSNVGLASGKVKKDTRTSLIWSASSSFLATNQMNATDGIRPTNGNAVAFCNALNSANYGNRNSWYLPTQKELMHAYIDGIYSQEPAFGTPNGFWSSTGAASNAEYAWRMLLSTGLTETNDKRSPNSVRCVVRD